MLSPININTTRFNSNTSLLFLDDYENFLERSAMESHNSIPSKMFAPSSMKCKRLSWFRLRGTKPDIDFKYDATNEFAAECGTALHKVVQSNLREIYKHNWINVNEYLSSVYAEDEYSAISSEDSLETLVTIPKYSIRFACDGILESNDKKYLFELKTVTYDKFKNIENILPQHEYQIYTYCTMLKLDKCLIMYLDRLYGDIKVFEVDVPQYIKDKILEDIQIVINCVKTNIAPEKLPNNSIECSYCKYVKSCKEY